MARSRNIKPGFFKNDILAEIEPLGRLLFAGLWTIADREGRLEDRPKRIKAEVLPYDDCNIDQLLQELHDRGFILRYEVDGKRYIQIVNFKKHQNPHKNEAPSAIPAPPEHSDTNTVQAPECSNTNPADSLNSDYFNMIPEEGPTPDERVILNTLKSVKNYPFNYEKDLHYIRTLAVDYPKLDIVAEIKKWAAYKLDKPLKNKSSPRSQIRNWMNKAMEFEEGGKHNGSITGHNVRGSPETHRARGSRKTEEDYRSGKYGGFFEN